MLVITGACRITGGIATTNLNILHALIDLVRENIIRLTVLSYLEREDDRPSFLPDSVSFKGFQSQKLTIAGSLLHAALKRPVFIFDHVTLALPVLPFAMTGAVKTIIFAHGSESWKLIRKTSSWSFKYASLCLTNSRYTLNKMRQKIPGFNGHACPLGLSPEFHINTKIPANNPDDIELEAADGEIHILTETVLLLVARLDSSEGQKGHRALIHVMPELIKEFPDVQLVFPGPGNDRKNLKELARQKGVASAVFLPGFVSIETLQRLYRHCYAFVMPSKQEGFGLVYLEAMNYAKPCVGCFDDGAEDVIVHGETGYLVHDPHNHKELLEVLRALLSDVEHTHALGKKGFERLHANFTSRHFQARIKEHITSILLWA